MDLSQKNAILFKIKLDFAENHHKTVAIGHGSDRFIYHEWGASSWA
jgi:hypothetical protein